jgi:hypothetical protein
MKRLFLALILLMFAGNGFTADVTLQWDANTEPDLAGYKIYYGNESGVYGEPIDAGNVVESTVTGLDDTKSYYFVITVYDNEIPSLESDYSNEVFVRYRTDGPPTKTNLLQGFWKIIISLFSKFKANWS